MIKKLDLVDCSLPNNSHVEGAYNMTRDTYRVNAINSFPSKSGIVIYQMSHFKNQYVAALLTRNIDNALNKLNKLNAAILYTFNVLNRDIEGKRIFRLFKKSLNIVNGNETTIIFELNDNKKNILYNLSTNSNIINPKIIIQKLKAFVRNTLNNIKNIKLINVNDLLRLTFPIVDGLSIEQYLTWLADDGFLKIYRSTSNFLDSKLKIL